MTHIRKQTSLALAMVSVMSIAHADITGGQSYFEENGMRIGETIVQQSEVVGIGVDGQMLLTQLTPVPLHDINSQDIYHWSGRKLSDKDMIQAQQGAVLCSGGVCNDLQSKWAQENIIKPAVQKDNRNLGTWSYARVGTQDVWFGEWHADTKGWLGAVNKVEGTHTVWYAGQNADVATTLPKGVAVSYTTRTMSHYKEQSRWNPKYWFSDPKLESSTFIADFDAGMAKAMGDINFINGSIHVDGPAVKLSADNVDVKSTGGKCGDLHGNFYGTGASAVAGFVQFPDRNQDISFGGAKTVVK